MIAQKMINDRIRETYSTEGFMIKKAGTEEVYSRARDLADSAFEYTETEIPVPEFKGMSGIGVAGLE